MKPNRPISARDRKLEFAIGLFFLSALIILGVYTIILKKDLFVYRYSLTIKFPFVGTLQEGDRVLLRGFPVGQIVRFELSENAKSIVVHANLSRELVFYDDYLIEIRQTSMLGGRHVYLDPGNSESGAIADDTILSGQPPVDLLAEAGDFIRQLKKDEEKIRRTLEEKKILENLGDAADDIRTLAEKVRKGEGTLGKLVYDENLYDETKETIENLRRASDQAAEMVDRVKRAGNSVELAGDSVREFGDKFNDILEDARQGKGTIGKLLNDDSLYTEAKDWIDDLRTVTKKMSSDESSLGRLMNDDGDFYDSIKSSFNSIEATFDSTQELVAKIKAGEGSLGKLVNDDTLYNETRNTVEMLQRTVREVREQAPISTFSSFIFGAL